MPRQTNLKCVDMTIIELEVPDDKMVPKVVQACKMLIGVSSVKVQRKEKTKENDITKTEGYREALDDIKNGRVYHADSVDDMFRQILA